MPAIIGLHHAQITIPKGTETDARRFYCELLGLPEIPKPASLEGRGGFWVMAGDREVHIGAEDGVDRHKTKGHLAYEVDDVFAWRSVLTTHGFQPFDDPVIPGYARFHIRDPFGNRVELIQRVATTH